MAEASRSEAAQRRSVLSGLSLANRAGDIAIAEVPIVQRFVLRGDAAQLEDIFGVNLPTEPLRAAGTVEAAALKLGPDEWLLLTANSAPLASALQTRVRGTASALVDVSHRNIGLDLGGQRAADVLASACPLDFDLTAFPIGQCTRTIYGKAEVIVWRTAAQAFHLEVWRSFAPYVVALLGEAVAGLPPAHAHVPASRQN
jgi:sarcosine oxidase, subunit gamma